MFGKFLLPLTIIGAIFVATISTGQAELSKQAQFDLLAAQLKDALIAVDYPKTLSIIKKLKGTGRDLGVEIIFIEGKALAETGKTRPAFELVSSYIKTVGRKGGNYQAALELYGKLETQIRQLAEAEKIRKAKAAKLASLRQCEAKNEAELNRKLGTVESIRMDWGFLTVALAPGKSIPSSAIYAKNSDNKSMPLKMGKRISDRRFSATMINMWMLTVGLPVYRVKETGDEDPCVAYRS